MPQMKANFVPSDPVKLCDAGYVGQLVLASSAESRYVCLLVGAKLNLAARILHGQASIRVEPTGGGEVDAAVSALLASQGFTVASNKRYASVHYTPLAAREAVMTVAAHIASLMSVAADSTKGDAVSFVDLVKVPGMGA
jgi:hypothetical protein